MKKNIVFLVATASAALAACQIQAGTGPQTPAGTTSTTTPAATPGTAIPSPTPKAPRERVTGMRNPLTAIQGKSRIAAHVGAPTTPTTPTTPGAPTDPTPPAGGEPPVVTGAIAFGSGDPKEANFLGSVYDIPVDSAKIPDLNALKPVATLFAKELNVSNRAYTEGFPGSTKKSEWFAIRYEAPLTVETEGDYDLTTNSDEGSVVYVDDVKIVDNDGAHKATEKTGPVHLVKGTHSLRIEYFQGAAGDAALQFSCNKMGGEKKICTGKL
jgi:hypothetical protein